MILATLSSCFFQRPAQTIRAGLAYPERRRRTPPIHSSVHSAVGAEQFSPARKRWVRSAMNMDSAVGAARFLTARTSEAEDAALKGRRYGKSNSYPRLTRLCYNRAAVNFTANPEHAQPAKACDSVEAASQAGRVPELLDKQ